MANKHLDVDIDNKSPEEPTSPHKQTSITVDEYGNTHISKDDGETYTIDRAAERALLWKFDLRILPLLTLMYLFNALDKANLGNAKTAGQFHVRSLRLLSR